MYGPVAGPTQSYQPSAPPQPYGFNYGGQQPYGHQLAVNQYGSHGAPAPTASPKSAGVALILSLLVTGLGHLYTGNPVAAVLWFFGAVLSGLLIAAAIGFVLLPAVWICAAIHAYMSANAFNRRHHVVH